MQIEKLTFEQIEDLIESELFRENNLSPLDFLNEEYFTSHHSIDDGELKEQYRKLGTIKLVTHYGGSGQGDDYYTVYHFVDHNIYVQFDGWYASHIGTEYSEMFEVKPVQVTVTKYNKVKS